MGCVICKPVAATSADDFCFSLFFPVAGSGATSAAEAKRDTRRLDYDDPLKPPALQRGASTTSTASRVITSPERDPHGWPTWFSAAAGDALVGWGPRRADSFEKLEKIGSGTYSNVYKANDLDRKCVVALKKVRVDGVTAVGPGEPQKKSTSEAARFMVREIALLRRLGSHPNIVELEGLVTSRVATSPSLYLVFEYMDHDLAGLAGAPGVEFSLPQIKCYMKQLLLGLKHCHENGVLHRDIKTSNLLLSKDGVLKIADFGLATSFDPARAQPMTTQVITLWYRPPELLLGATLYGVGVDLWSVGCILGELLMGQPIFPARTEVEQLHKIFKVCGTPTEELWKKLKLPNIHTTFRSYERCLAETFKDVPPSALSLLETLLSIDPDSRGTASDALNSDFFMTEPYACEPSSLPQYPPSKEMDIKLRNQERRRKARDSGLGGYDTVKQVRLRNSKQLKAILTPQIQANTGVPRLVTSASARTKQDKFPPPHLDGSIGHSLDTTSDVSEEFFSSTVVELRKDRSLRKKSSSLMEHPMKNPSRRKGNVTKVRPAVKMAPPILIGGFRPYQVGKPKMHGKAKVKDSGQVN
ncbi:Protein kinase superfamily protein [Rhynchospora pubera]|uniref:[RNA-polymerase]-subunit kinase n=1 Tax=Rhynchospora pubera TaxID=906938 RepID=A0AAV8CP81_9POAL|nr:Protein kinase superfamily protein [Rhynchospora pubera]